MTENRAKGMTGIWALTPGQVAEANTAPSPPKTGSWLLDVGDREVRLEKKDGCQFYDAAKVRLEEINDGYNLRVSGNEQ